MTRDRGRTYEDVLAELAKRYPRLHAPLGAANKSRAATLESLLGGARLRGLDELLRHLETVAEAFEGGGDPLDRIAFLVRRALSDFEVALEATLSALVSVAHEAMRDVMEIELLLLDFASELDRIEQWLTLPAKERRQTFQPAVLRKRLKTAGIGRYAGAGKRDPDYAAHSEALHVSPRKLVFAKGVQPEDDGGFLRDSGFWEIFEHARRLLFAIDQLRGRFPGVAWDTVAATDDLAAFISAWERTQEMQAIFLAIWQAGAEVGAEDDEDDGKAMESTDDERTPTRRSREG